MEIERKDYLQILKDSAGKTDLVKVLTGMRRTGKTTVMLQHLAYLRSSGVPEGSICYIDIDLLGEEIGADELRGMIQPCLDRDGIHYILIDEIQDVDGWERVVAMLVARKDCDVYITGSNSRMLSSELSTKLSGRYMEVDILPLSFREFMELHGGDETERFLQYIRYGPLPSVEPERGGQGLPGAIGGGVLHGDDEGRAVPRVRQGREAEGGVPLPVLQHRQGDKCGQDIRGTEAVR